MKENKKKRKKEKHGGEYRKVGIALERKKDRKREIMNNKVPLHLRQNVGGNNAGSDL